MKALVIISIMFLSSAAFAGTKENTKEVSRHDTRPGHKLTIDLDQLSRQTKDISLLQPVIAVVKWMSRPAPVQQIRKEKSLFI